MRWYTVKQNLPSEERDGYSIDVLISDGENISVGYTYQGKNKKLMWEDLLCKLKRDKNNLPVVKYWRHIPKLCLTNLK